MNISSIKKIIYAESMAILKRVALPLIVLATICCMISCSKQNEKLKIDDKKYTISLGAVNYDADTRVATIEVLADGNPLPNKTVHRSTSISVGDMAMSPSVSSFQPVKMQLIVNGVIDDYLLKSISEDGIFTFWVDEAPERIAVYTGMKSGENVYFNGKTKEVISAGEYYKDTKGKPFSGTTE